MERKNLIVYYSHSGNTETVAKAIQSKTNGVLCKISPIVPYPDEYKAVVAQARVEIPHDFKPKINEINIEIDKYDTFFVGSPNWCRTFAPPIATFLSQNNFDGKIIVPFCTHGGGGAGTIAKDIAKLCPKANVMSIFSCREGKVDGKDISKWLAKELDI